MKDSSAMHKLVEHPLNLLAMGGVSTGVGIWAMITKALTVGTLLLSFFAALCGAITGAYGVYIIWRKYKRGDLFKD